MKKVEQIQLETNCSAVFTKEEFVDYVLKGCISPYDGNGYFYDGEKETKISVWDKVTPKTVKNYSYICWYNK